MRKLVNGQVVDIQNMELFEKAAEGAALAKKAVSRIDTRITADSDNVNECIKIYEVIYKAMPFPLYCIETVIKHAAIACLIKQYARHKYSMWIDDELCICIDEKSKIAVKLIGNTWGLVKVDKIKEDNTDIELYANEVGYAEFKWFINNVRRGTGNFYKEFMPEFVEACKGEEIILKWELANILTFANVPDEIKLPNNKIIDIESEAEYQLDIYPNGQKNTGEVEQIIRISINEESSFRIKNKSIRVYEYDAYVKNTSLGVNGDSAKLRKTDVVGLNNLFLTLCGIKMSNDNIEFSTYRGLIADGNLVYEIDNRIYICKAYKKSEPIELARGSTIVGYDRGVLYIKKQTLLEAGVKKEAIYSYTASSGNIRICKIQFII